MQECLRPIGAGATHRPTRVENINGGTPRNALALAIPAWSGPFSKKPLIPILGELAHLMPQEIGDFGAAVKERGVRELHAYPDSASVSTDNLAAVAAL
jgi:hypothetical protein